MAKTATATVATEQANQSGMTARGAAVAEGYLNACKEQGNTLKRYLVDIGTLDQTGRKAFRVTVQRQLNEMRKHVKSFDGKPESELMKRTIRSATVRVSEAINFSKAVDAGFTFEAVKESYHSAVAGARMFLKSVGAGSDRGRPAVPVNDKIRKYLGGMVENGDITPKDLVSLLAEIEEEFKGKKSAKKAETPASPAKVAVKRAGPTRRKTAAAPEQQERRTEENPIPPFGIERRVAMEPAANVH